MSTAPNYVTRRGLDLLRKSLADAEAAGDEREQRYYAERIETAIVIDPAKQTKGVVEFGSLVRARDARGRELRIRIVGEDEADPAHGSVSWQSPIAQAFSDRHVGERVVVHRPAGPISYTIDGIEYD